ncbi:hypothetical protein LH464_23175, partial [Neorhizobium sp. T786]|uniref:hypothetical protein n=1 Tax=Pseudorhizobium xiangyangii TaxID=2883104 RepID=UPI001CFFF3AB
MPLDDKRYSKEIFAFPDLMKKTPKPSARHRPETFSTTVDDAQIEKAPPSPAGPNQVIEQKLLDDGG